MKTSAILLAALTLATASAQTPSKPQTARLRIPQLVCHGCSLEVYRSLVGSPGFVKVIDSDAKRNEIRVLFDPKATTPSRLSRRVSAKTGWKVTVLAQS